MKKIKVFHHSADIDGLFSGKVLKEKFPEADLQGWDYGDELPSVQELLQYDHVYLVDMTFPVEMLNEIGNEVKVTVYDHHKSFRDEVSKFVGEGVDIKFEYHFDERLCGAEIAYQNLFGGRIPDILKHVGDFDTWRMNSHSEIWNNVTMPFQYAFRNRFLKVDDIPSIIYWSSDGLLSELLVEGKAIHSYVQNNDVQICKKYAFEKKCFGGLNGLFLNVPFFNSDTTKSIYEHGKHDVIVGFTYEPTNGFKVSIRSIGDNAVDVGEIAKRFGGGGHHRAAGFHVEDLKLLFD